MTQRNAAGQYVKGVSGNPKGLKKGTRRKATLIAEEMFRGELKPITRAVIEAAVEGDMQAARIVFERLYPIRKGAPVRIEGMPKIETLADVHGAITTITSLMADGEISPEEAMACSAVVEVQRRAIETIDLERRLAKLEEQS